MTEDNIPYIEDDGDDVKNATEEWAQGKSDFGVEVDIEHM